MHKKLDRLVFKYHENRLSHAFLVETNDFNKCLADIKEFLKKICCVNNTNEDEECSICYQIEKESLPNIVKIYPDGSSIKKSQIQELKEKFQKQPLYIKYNIYLICHAEKLTLSSANTMLKFLEEPDGQVLGFFIVDNKENLLKTIVSRCQCINLYYEQENLLQSLEMDSEQYNNYLSAIYLYIEQLEKDYEMAIIETKKLVLDIFKDRIQISHFFQIIIKVYEEVFNRKIGKTENSEFDKFSFLVEMNSIKSLIRKLKIIENTIMKLNYNPNLELLLENFALEMGNKDESLRSVI